MGLNNSTSEKSVMNSKKPISSQPPTPTKPINRSTAKLNDLYEEGVSLNDFEVLNSVIGEGGFAKVMKVRHIKTKEVYACKVLSKKQLLDEKQVVNTFIERGILIRLQNPFIVSLQFAFQTEKNLFYVMDYCAGGDFFEWIK